MFVTLVQMNPSAKHILPYFMNIIHAQSLPGQHSNLVCRNSHTSSEQHLCLKLQTAPSSQELWLLWEGLAGMCSACHLGQTIVVGPLLMNCSVPSVDWILQALAAKISPHWAIQAQFFRFTATKFGQIFRRVAKAKSLRWGVGSCQYLSLISSPWGFMFILSLHFPLIFLLYYI